MDQNEFDPTLEVDLENTEENDTVTGVNAQKVNAWKRFCTTCAK